MTEQKGQEHRRLPRVDRHYMVRYRPISAGGGGGWLVSPLRDLSSGGARFISEHPFTPGEAFEMQLLLPISTQPIAMKARVAWVKTRTMSMVEMGITFDPGDIALQRTIDAAISRFIQKPTGN